MFDHLSQGYQNSEPILMPIFLLILVNREPLGEKQIHEQKGFILVTAGLYLQTDPQAGRRHPQDTPQVPFIAIRRIKTSFYNWFQFIRHLHPRYLPDTLRHHPDTARHPQTPSWPYKTTSDTPIFGLHVATGRKSNISEYHDIYSTGFKLSTHPRHLPDILRHLPDTVRHPQTP